MLKEFGVIKFFKLGADAFVLGKTFLGFFSSRPRFCMPLAIFGLHMTLTIYGQIVSICSFADLYYGAYECSCPAFVAFNLFSKGGY